MPPSQKPVQNAASGSRDQSGQDTDSPIFDEAELKERHRLYEADIKERHQTIRLMAMEYDKGILSFSTAGLGLSWAFLRDSSYNMSPIEKGALGLSWVCFILAIIAIIVSFALSRRAEEEEIVKSRKYYIGGDSTILGNKNEFDVWNGRFGLVGGALFSLAVISTISVAALTLFAAKPADSRQPHVVVMKGATIVMSDILQKGIPTAPRIAVSPAPQAQPAHTGQPNSSQGSSSPGGSNSSGGK